MSLRRFIVADNPEMRTNNMINPSRIIQAIQEVNSKACLLACLALLGIGILCSSCSSVRGARSSNPSVPYPEARFAVMSDLHLYSKDLGTHGAAFRKDLAKDRKLLVETPELLDAAIAKINALPVDFVLITGDLTKDGEALNHKLVAAKLRLLTQNGKKVFVINGNHDIRNGVAKRYSEAGEQAVPSVTPAEFAAIYHDDGYGAALARDAHSMSYVAEPVKGLWILAMDSCQHQENKPSMTPETAGKFSPETLAWIKRNLDKARAEGKAVIGMMHHGALEHYQGNRNYYSEYVVADHEKVSRMFAGGGMNLLFTGHFHAQDVTSSLQPNRWLYDIETGSLATYPCPYRVISITNQTLTVHSERIPSIASHRRDFPQYARQSSLDASARLTAAALNKFRLSQSDSAKVVPQIAATYTAHLAGDEVAPTKVIDTRGVSLWGRLIVSTKRSLLYGWQHDLPPADNELAVDLKSGKPICSTPRQMNWQTNASNSRVEARHPDYPTHNCADHGRGFRLARNATP